MYCRSRVLLLLCIAACVQGNSTEHIPCDSSDGHALNKFHWVDYAVLVAMLVVSCGIGMFYGFFSGKQKTSNDFLLGGSSMGTVPMALSLAAGFITAIELLGNPAEMYNYGTQFWMTCVSFLFVVPITSYFYLPVYMELRLTSSYEYLELRFDKYARVLASGMYVIQMTLYTSVAVYAPALALSHVTGLNVYLAVTLVYFVCIFYASQGGMKAVIMTDTFQAAVLIISIVLILGMGNYLVGGASYVFDHNRSANRLELLILDLNPTIRHSVWSVVIGGTFYWATMFCSNQASIQKYLSVETISQARSAIWVSSIGLIFIFTVNFYTGMIMYSEYKDCDPLRSKIITAQDELLPLFVMSTLGTYKGIPGLFVAGIFAASLGTVASALNSLAAVTMKDFLGCLCGVVIPEEKGASTSKWLSLFFGVISFGLVFIVEQLGSVLQVALSFNGMAGGVTLGLFSLGMFFPWANSKGALTGGSVALVFVMWIGIGTQYAMTKGYDPAEHKVTSVAGCPCAVTQEDLLANTANTQEVLFIYRLSYLWYSAIGVIVTVVVGMMTSLLTGPDNPGSIHPSLISPPLQTLYQSLPNSIKERLNLPLTSKDSKDGENTGLGNTSSSQNMIGVINPALNLDEEYPSLNTQQTALDL